MKTRKWSAASGLATLLAGGALVVTSAAFGLGLGLLLMAFGGFLLVGAVRPARRA